MVDITERTAAVAAKDFDPKELHPEYRGWRSNRERAEISLATAIELVRSGKVTRVLLAQQSADGAFGILALTRDDHGKYFLLERKRSSIGRDSFIEAYADEKRGGKQRVEVRLVTPEPRSHQEESFTDFIEYIEQYKGMPGATMLTGQWEDEEWVPSAKYRVMHQFVAEKNKYGWVERWSVGQGRSALSGRKIPVTRPPLGVIGDSKK